MLTHEAIRRLHALKDLQQEIRDEDASLVRLQMRAKHIGFGATLATTGAVILRSTGRTVHCADIDEAWYRMALLTKEFNALQSIATRAQPISATA